MVPRSTGTPAEDRNTEVGCGRLWDWRGPLSVAFYFRRGLLDLAFESSQAAARGSLPRTKACRRRRIHRPRRTTLHCVCQVSCLVEGFAVFPERSAWPCESVDWIQSYYPILTFRGLCLHGSPQTGDSFTYPNASIKASIKVRGRRPATLSGTKYFLTFCLLDVP